MLLYNPGMQVASIIPQTAHVQMHLKGLQSSNPQMGSLKEWTEELKQSMIFKKRSDWTHLFPHNTFPHHVSKDGIGLQYFRAKTLDVSSELRKQVVGTQYLTMYRLDNVKLGAGYVNPASLFVLH